MTEIVRRGGETLKLLSHDEFTAVRSCHVEPRAASLVPRLVTLFEARRRCDQMLGLGAQSEHPKGFTAWGRPYVIPAVGERVQTSTGISQPVGR